MDDMIQGIGQIAIPVKDLNRAISFYKNELEFPFLFQAGSIAFFDCNGTRLFLSLPEKEEFSRFSSIIYFRVNDIFETYEKCKTKNIEFIDQPHMIAKVNDTENWMCFFYDSEGNMLAFMSEKVVTT